MTQNKSSAVMQQRAAREIEGDDDQRKRWRDLDFFPTPPWAARAGAMIIRDMEERRGLSISTMLAWEPACGEGHIAFPLEQFFGTVTWSDVHDYGINPLGERYDFLGPVCTRTCDWIITNPPFLKAAEFVERGLEMAKRGVAVLCRVAFIESEKRYRLLFGGAHPLTVFAPFIERVPMQLGSWDPDLSTATAYAWFVFHKHVSQFNPVVVPVPPGTKAKLTKPDDIARFARKKDAPLLKGIA